MQIGKIDSARSGETNDHHRFVGGWDPARGERIRGIDRGNPLEINVGFGELRANIMDIIGHPPQHRVHYLFRRIAARRAITTDFLNPFEVDHWDDTDLQVGILGDIHLVRLDRAMQTFIKKKIAFYGQSLPFGKGSWRATEVLGLFVVMDIMPRLASSGFAIAAKK